MRKIEVSFVFIFLLFFIAKSLSQGRIKEVSTRDEYCKIYNYLQKHADEDETVLIKKLGYDSKSFIAYGFNHPELLNGCDNVMLPSEGINVEPIYYTCNLRWHKKYLDRSLDKGWIKTRLSNLRIIDAEKGIVEANVVMENTKAIFFELAAANLHGENGVNCVSPPLRSGVLLYPKETLELETPLRLRMSCDKSANSGLYECELNFSRGELTGITIDALITQIATFIIVPVPLQPFTSRGMQIGYSNKAAYMSIFHIFWTVLTGEWLSRDFIENGLSTLGAYGDFADKLQPIGGGLAADFVGIIYSKKIEPQVVIRMIIEGCIAILKNPLTSKAAFEILKKYMSTLAEGGAEALAANLSVILAGGQRVFALTPIAWDSASTTSMEDFITIQIEADCCLKE